VNECSRSQKALTDLKRQIEAKTPPLSTAGKFGVRTVTLLFIKFAKTLHKAGVDAQFLEETLEDQTHIHTHIRRERERERVSVSVCVWE